MGSPIQISVSRFRLAIYPNQPVHELLVIRGHGAGSCPDGFTGRVQVLTDVPGVQGDHLRTAEDQDPTVNGNRVFPATFHVSNLPLIRAFL
jgi:hypothetical protein